MQKYRADIDGLRALAIMPVVLYHASIPGFGGGFVGVDIFFVISGFLITGILRQEIEARNFSLIRFYERRIKRIVPAYIVVCIVVFLVSLWMLMPRDFTNMANSLIASLFFVSNMYFAGQMSYFQQGAGELPLLHLWSLSVEEQFYLFWPIFLLFFMRFIDRRWWSIILLLMIGGSLAITQWALQHKNATAVFFFAPFRFWELMTGAYLVLSPPPRLKSEFPKAVVSVAALLLICMPVVLYTSKWPSFPGLAAIPPSLGAMLVIYLGIHDKSILSPLLGSRVLSGIGLLSYSLYLWHWPVIAFFHVFMDRDPTLSEALVLIATSLLLAYLSWRYVEGPFRQKGPKVVLKNRKSTFILAGSSFAILAALGFTSVSLHGFPGRANSAFRAMEIAIPSSRVYEKCLHARKMREVNVDIDGCIVGNATPQMDVVWGDSHASAYFQGMGKLAEQHHRHIKLLAMQSCDPTMHLPTSDGPLGQADAACSQFNTRVLKEIIADPQINTVYLSGFWLSSLLNESSTSVEGLPVITPGSLQGLRARIFTAIEPLHKAGKRVVLLPDPPYFPEGGGKCVEKTTFMGLSSYHCGISLAYYQATTEKVNSMLRSVPNAEIIPSFIDPKELFCNPNSCTPNIDGIPAFIDKHHLNSRGSEKILTHVQ